MWTLVYLVFINGELRTTQMGSYDDMFKCFEAREILSEKQGGKDGWFPPDTQAICVFRSPSI